MLNLISSVSNKALSPSYLFQIDVFRFLGTELRSIKRSKWCVVTSDEKFYDHLQILVVFIHSTHRLRNSGFCDLQKHSLFFFNHLAILPLFHYSHLTFTFRLLANNINEKLTLAIILQIQNWPFGFPKATKVY